MTTKKTSSSSSSSSKTATKTAATTSAAGAVKKRKTRKSGGKASTAALATVEGADFAPVEVALVEVEENKNKRFNRKKIAEAIAHTEGLTLAQSERITQLMIDTIIFAVCDGRSVYLPNLGKFEASYMPPRSGRHPRTHDPMVVKEGLRLKFVAATPVNRKLNEESEDLMEKLKEKLQEKQAAAASKKQLQQQQQRLLTGETDDILTVEAVPA